MKKLNYLILGIAGLSLASCSQEDVVGPASGDGNVEITLNLPADLTTRADLGSGQSVANLQYAIYEVGGTADAPTYTFRNKASVDGAFSGSQTYSLRLNLLTGKSYAVAFFAESANGAGVYSFNCNPDGGATPNLAVDYSAMESENNNADGYDCFYALWTTDGDVTGPISGNVTLTRPVAQINWGSNDLTDALVAAAYDEGFYTSLKVTNVPTAIDLFTGAVTATAAEATIGIFQNPSEATFPAGSSYGYLAMQYVLAESTSNNLNLELTIQNAESTPSESTTVSVTEVPVQANYRTNIYGSLLTNQADLNVNINSDWTDSYYDDLKAVVKFNSDGLVECITPALPSGVSPSDFGENNGAVAIVNGQPKFYPNTGTGINTAMQEASEIYLAPNATISAGSHIMRIPATGITIHGNGATMEDGEHDFAIEYTTFTKGSNVTVNINNLNGVKVWGNTTTSFTLNVNLTNCTHTGTGLSDGNGLIMTRGGDKTSIATINFNVNNCYVQNVQVGAHSTYAGQINFNNCKFNEVGIPINIAKKEPDAKATVIANDCVFTSCGITEGTNSAWDYAAPVRVVDNGGPENSVKVVVNGCTFTGNKSDYDILLWDYRTGKTSFLEEYSVTNCTPANPVIYVDPKNILNQK